MIHEMLPLVNFITTISSFYLLRVNNNEGLVGIFVLKTQKVQKTERRILRPVSDCSIWSFKPRGYYAG